MKLFKRTLSYLSSKDGFHSNHGRKRNISQSNTLSVVINGNPKVACFSTNFSESESCHTSIVGQQSAFRDGFHFIHGRGTLINGNPKVQ